MARSEELRGANHRAQDGQAQRSTAVSHVATPQATREGNVSGSTHRGPSTLIAKQARALCSTVDDAVEYHRKHNPQVPLSTLYQPGERSTPQGRLRQLIPKISVVGQQSSGKSSLLNCVLRTLGGWDEGCLPVGSNITTLFPTSIFLADSKKTDALIEGIVPGATEGSKEVLTPQRVKVSDAQGKVRETLEAANAQLAAFAARIPGKQAGRHTRKRLRREEALLKGASQYELKVTLSKKDQVEFHLVDLPGIPSGVAGANEVVASLYRQHVPSSQVVVLVTDARKEFFQDFSWGVVTNGIQDAAVPPKLVVVLNRAESLAPEPGESLMLKKWPQLFQLKVELGKLTNAGIACSTFFTYAKAANGEAEVAAIHNTGVTPVAEQLQWQTGVSALTECLTKEYTALFPKGRDLRAAVAAVTDGIRSSLDQIGWITSDEARRMQTLETVKQNLRALKRLDAVPEGFDGTEGESPLNLKLEELQDDIHNNIADIVSPCVLSQFWPAGALNGYCRFERPKNARQLTGRWKLDISAAGVMLADPAPRSPDGSLVLPHSEVEKFARMVRVNQAHIVKVKGLECYYHVVAKCHDTLMAHVRRTVDAPLRRLGELVDPFVEAMKVSDKTLPASAAPALRKIQAALRNAVPTCIQTCRTRMESALAVVENPPEISVFEEVIKALVATCPKFWGPQNQGSCVSVNELLHRARGRDWLGVEVPKSVEHALWNEHVVPVLQGVVRAAPGSAVHDLYQAATEAASCLVLEDIESEGRTIATERLKLFAAHDAAQVLLSSVG